MKKIIYRDRMTSKLYATRNYKSDSELQNKISELNSVKSPLGRTKAFCDLKIVGVK